MKNTRTRSNTGWNIDHLVNEVLNTNLNELIHTNKDFLQQTPPVNIYESEQYFRLELAMPGRKREDVNIHLEDGILKVTADVELALSEKEKLKTRQFAFAKFKKTYRIPRSVDPTKISAKLEKGILNIKLMKAEGTQAHSIKIS